MAARMSDRSIQRKEDYLDWMHEKFCASSRAYVSAVKAALRSETRENAAEIFERAIDVLSPDFPDPTCIDGQTQEEEGGDGNELNSLKDRIAQIERQLQEAQNERSTLESELKSVKQEAQNERSTLESELKSVKQEAQTKCSTLESELEFVKQEAQNKSSTLESELQSVRQEAQTKCSTLESELESVRQEAQTKCSTLESELKSVRQEAQLNSSMKKNVRRLNTKLQTLASETKGSIKELTEILQENSANIQKLQKQIDQTAAAAAAAAVTPPPTGATASALSKPLKDVRQRADFTVKVTADKHRPDIEDVQLLPGGRLLLADVANERVKLFDTQGQHLHTLECRGKPCCLAVLDSLSIRHTVAVTLPRCSGIDILEVNGDNMEVKRTLQTSRQYLAVAAVNNLTLAVGYWLVSGIDLIDLGGQVLRQISSSVPPWYMDITEDGGLICSTGNKIARVQVDTGTVVFDKSVPQIEYPRGVAITPDRSILVTDRYNKTLHLVSSQGIWVKQLWSVPSDRDQNDKLYAVSTDGSVCVCVTWSGSVYILDCL